MAVFRIEKNKNYTNMSNYHFYDKTLSWKAKGILSNMLSLPDDWDYSLAGLATLTSDGMSATRTAIKELEEHGYLIRRPIRENGKIKDWEYVIFECPQVARQDVEKPLVENQQIENHTQLNTKELNTKKSKTKELNTKEIKEDIPIEFETLWKMYPRKLGKPKALKSYTKARKNGVTFEQVKEGIENYLEQIKAKNTETEFIKHGSTWFGNECWNDEYDTTNKGDVTNGTDNANSSDEPPAWSGKWF